MKIVMKICETCGKEFPGRGVTKRFCSSTCRCKAFFKRQENVIKTLEVEKENVLKTLQEEKNVSKTLQVENETFHKQKEMSLKRQHREHIKPLEFPNTIICDQCGRKVKFNEIYCVTNVVNGQTVIYTAWCRSCNNKPCGV